MVTIIIALMIRDVSFEYRSKGALRLDSGGGLLFLSSFLFGIVFTDLLGGVPIDQNLNYAGTPFGWITPYGLIAGLTMVSVFLLHGANFLTLKLDDKLRERARAAARILYIFTATMVVVLAISTYIYTDIGIRIGINPGVLPIASVVVLLVTIYFINRKMEGSAFVMSGLNIILTQIAFFSLMFPRVMVSSLNPTWSLTIYTTTSPQALQRKA